MIIKLRTVKPEIRRRYHEINKQHGKKHDYRNKEQEPPHIHKRQNILKHLTTARVVIGYCKKYCIPGTDKKRCPV
jgi:DsbC/DsbD-like thiol-disulfide interchange protein